MTNLEDEARRLIKAGVYDPEVLFQTIYQKYPVHYSRVRDAVHKAKVW